MSKIKHFITGIGLTLSLSGCGKPEEVKSYHITLKVGNQVSTITMQGSRISCTTGLGKIPRTSQIMRNEDPIQLKEGVEFTGDGFEVRRTPDSRYTNIFSQLPAGGGGGEVARVINIGGNGTKRITQKEGEDLCRK